MNCEKCGVQLSLPGDHCQNCGHPIYATHTLPRTHPAPIDTAPPPPGETLPDEDATRVEKLLGHIAGQSHFEERYLLRGELARGGMGLVHRAYDQILRREVAIKMMHDGYGGSADSAAIRGRPGVVLRPRPVARAAVATPGVGAPGVGIRPGTPMNRGGPVNRAGRR